MEKVMLTASEMSLTVKELAKKINVSRITAWRAKRSGYYSKDYHMKKNDIQAIKQKALIAFIYDIDIFAIANISPSHKQVMQDVRRAKNTLTKSQYKSVIKHITEINTKLDLIVKCKLVYSDRYANSETIHKLLSSLIFDNRVKKSKIFNNPSGTKMLANVRSGGNVSHEQAVQAQKSAKCMYDKISTFLAL